MAFPLHALSSHIQHLHSMARRSIANPSSRAPSPTFINPASCQDDEHMSGGSDNPGYGGGGDTQGADDSHNAPQGYSHLRLNGRWETDAFPATPTLDPDMVYGVPTSEYLQATTLGAAEHNGLYSRIGLVPSNPQTFQPTSQQQPTPGILTGFPMLQGPPPMVGNQYQQHLTQPTISGPSAPLTTTGGYMLSPHSGFPPHNPQYTSQHPHLHPHPQPNPGFSIDTPPSPYVDRRHSTDTSRGGGDGGTVGRTPRPRSRMNRRQRRNSVSCARDTTGWMQSAVSPTDFSSVASSSETRVGGSEFATSPNVYLGPFYKPLSNSTSTSGAPEGFDETEQKNLRQREKQRLKKRDDRKAESEQLDRVKELLRLSHETKAETLEIVIGFLGGSVPARRNDPTPALPGRDRSDRAIRVSGGRNAISQLFATVVELMGYGTGTVPKREQILKDVAEEIERRMAGMHPPLPQGAGDQADTSG